MGQRPHNDAWQKKADRNAATLTNQIAKLKDGHWDNFRRDYKSFWAHVKEINQAFKETKPLRREDREDLWQRFQGIIEETKRKQGSERESRQNQSREKRGLVEQTIKEAYFYAKGAKTRSDIQKAKDLLSQALQRMKKGWDGFSAATQVFSRTDGKMTKEDHEECWQKWLEAKEALNYRQEEVFDVNYSHFKSEAYKAKQIASADPKEAKNKVREVQAGLKTTYMMKEQFEEIREILDEAWREASNEQQRAWESRQRRHDEWKERQEGHIDRWEALIEKNESVISSLESQIDRCEDIARDAKTSDFESEVRGWIEEKADKIRDIRATNRELEDRIRSVQDKLR